MCLETYCDIVLCISIWYHIGNLVWFWWSSVNLEWYYLNKTSSFNFAWNKTNLVTDDHLFVIIVRGEISLWFWFSWAEYSQTWISMYCQVDLKLSRKSVVDLTLVELESSEAHTFVSINQAYFTFNYCVIYLLL